jgi:hypothetical protein
MSLIFRCRLELRLYTNVSMKIWHHILLDVIDLSYLLDTLYEEKYRECPIRITTLVYMWNPSASIKLSI